MTTVRVATTAAGTRASDFENGDTIDGVVLATGDLILIKDQAAGTENGVYIVEAAGSPTRAHPFRAGIDIAGEFVYATEGTANANTGWICVNDIGSATVGTDALVFERNINIPTMSTTSTETLTNKAITGNTNTVEAVSVRTTGASVTVSGSAEPTAEGFILTTDTATTASWKQRFEMFHGYTTVVTNLNAGFTAIPWNVEKRKDSIYTHTAASSDVRVSATADYLIICEIVVDKGAGANFVDGEGRLMRDPGGGFVEITGSRCTFSALIPSCGNATGRITMIVSLSSGDSVRAEAQRLTGTGTLETKADQCRFFIRRLD